MKKTLHLFTHTYPFGYGETFINNEIKYLSSSFDKINIYPLFNFDNNIRNVPENVLIHEPLIQNNFKLLKNIFCISALKPYLKDFITNKVYLSGIRGIKTFVIDYSISNVIINSQLFKKLDYINNDNNILYFYWGKGWANLLPFYKLNSKIVVRLHGGDLYRYRQYIPLQLEILKLADHICFISKNGLDYLSNVYPNIKWKFNVSYLGTTDNGISKKSFDNKIRVLSCSSVIPLKRIFKIFDTLNSINELEIEWTHIGDGIEFNKLKKYVILNSNKNIKVNLLGNLSNKLVIEYYIKSQIDLFINLSKTEGLPVSIMEAISFGVPVIATDVGGTSEIVNFKTGILVSSEITNSQLSKIIIQRNYSALKPKVFWSEIFNAEKNYPDFIGNYLNSKENKHFNSAKD